MNTGIGLGLMVGTISLGHRTLRTAVPILYGLSVFMILLVLTPLGATINGQRNWLVAGGLSLQPTAEFIKITIILGMAMLLAARVDAGDKQYPDHRTVLQALGLAAVPMMIVMLMPRPGHDHGRGHHRARRAARLRRLQPLGVRSARRRCAGRGGDLAAQDPRRVPDQPLHPAFANPDLDPAGVGYNTNQARYNAIGSGGLFGTGLGHGSQTTASSSQKSRRTSSSRSRARNWASWAPA